MMKINRFMKKHQGQSTVEYIVLVAAVIAALIVFLKPGGFFAQSVNKTLQSATQSMNKMSNRLVNSY